MAISDFNGDGKLDLAVANRNSNNVSILLGNGNGTFLGALNFAAGQLPVHVTSGDFNGDGRPDLAVANATGFSQGAVSVLLGVGRGFFLPPLSSIVGSNPSFVAAADFNLVGIINIVPDQRRKLGREIGISLEIFPGLRRVETLRVLVNGGNQGLSARN